MSLTPPRRSALLLLVLLATACGTTVPNAEQLGRTATGPAGGLSVDGGLVPPTGGVPGQPGTGAAGGPVLGGPQAGAGGSTGDGVAPGGAAPGVPGPGSGSGPGGVAIATPGVTDKEVYVGVVVDENAGAVNQAAGLGAITSGDTKANTEAVVKDINRRGGVAGRKLVPVYAPFDSTSTQTLDQQWAAVCQRFTRDKPRVFAVLDAGTESYRECVSRAGVVLLSNNLPTVDAAALARYPGFIEQGYPNLDRLAAYHVTPLVAQQYFTPWNTVTAQPAPTGTVKVGIITYDDKVFAGAVERHLVPALRKLGYDPIVARIAQVSTASDYGAQAAAASSAQLSFAANGVTHVIPFESNGGLSVFFMANARSQGYFPRYGVSTASGFQALIETGAYDSRQMNGAVGFGWVPSIDIPRAANGADGPYSNEPRRACLKVMRDNGISFDSGNAEAIALNTCASLYLLKAVGDRVGTRLALGTFIKGVESLGTSYQKAGGLGQEFRPGRHDPANKAYFWRYAESCTCMQYHGPLRTIP